MQDSRSLNIDMTNSYLSSGIALNFFSSEFPEEANSYLSVSSIHKVSKEHPDHNSEKVGSSSQFMKICQRKTLEKNETEHETCEGTFENDSALMEISAVLMVHECKEILQDLQQRLIYNVNKISQENEENAKLCRLAEDLKLKHQDVIFNSKIEPGCSCSIV